MATNDLKASLDQLSQVISDCTYLKPDDSEQIKSWLQRMDESAKQIVKEKLLAGLNSSGVFEIVRNQKLKMADMLVAEAVYVPIYVNNLPAKEWREVFNIFFESIRTDCLNVFEARLVRTANRIEYEANKILSVEVRTRQLQLVQTLQSEIKIAKLSLLGKERRADGLNNATAFGNQLDKAMKKFYPAMRKVRWIIVLVAMT